MRRQKAGRQPSPKAGLALTSNFRFNPSRIVTEAENEPQPRARSTKPQQNSAALPLYIERPPQSHSQPPRQHQRPSTAADSHRPHSYFGQNPPRRTRTSFPPAILARVRPARHGPRSIAGNIKMPVNFGKGSWRMRCGAATKSAPIQEIANVSTK